ncbi:hypothetical protein BB560_006294 [Smittium megazygosporum]|uniref:Uncharacterized protein n=1 Tax=Smittium megazygosporum TaxID=133381 RepID=A0A2T9YAZ8_9FUNG|nr:hypothetical protein BB560_006294 [Smittium megazygosporum]
MNELENKVFDKTSVIKTEKVQDFLRDYSFDGFCVTVDGKGGGKPQFKKNKLKRPTYQWTERDVTDFEKDKTGFIKDEYLGSYFNCTSGEGPIPSELHVLDSMDIINKKVQKFKELGLGGLVLNGVDLTRKKYSFNKISKADGHCIPQN